MVSIRSAVVCHTADLDFVERAETRARASQIDKAAHEYKTRA
jgi:hypothetical protein